MDAWVLNLDANEELADPSRTTRARGIASRLPELGRRTGLVAEGDVIVTPGVRADGLIGRAWMPTPSALAELAEAGAIVPAAPSVEVLRRVNARAFAGSLAALPGARAATTEAEALAALALPSPTGRWLAKRAFAFAGRGRRTVAGLTGADRAWIATSLRREGALWIEPFVPLAGDFAQHGFVEPDGSFTLGAATVQRCDARGVWEASELATADDLTPVELETLASAARATARALGRAGYFGPFGIDGFRWTTASGERAFHAPSDVNARYTMGYRVGMGAAEPRVEKGTLGVDNLTGR